MALSYNKLWKLLIDRNMTKTDLRMSAGFGTSTLAKLSKGETVTTEIIDRICAALDVQPGDIMEYLDES